MTIQFVGLPTTTVAHLKSSGRDTHDQPIERHLASEGAYPCRHCLGNTQIGEHYLILAHRPFQGVNPYTETGPIFLCAADCLAFEPSAQMPEMLSSPQYLVRGYTSDERICYGTGRIVETDRIADYAGDLFANPDIAFVDVRSASNNCFQCRIVPA